MVVFGTHSIWLQERKGEESRPNVLQFITETIEVNAMKGKAYLSLKIIKMRILSIKLSTSPRSLVLGQTWTGSEAGTVVWREA